MNTRKGKVFYALYNQGISEPAIYIAKLYKGGMSCREIVDYLSKNFNVECTDRGIDYYLKKTGTQIRSYKEAKINAINRGRMIYYKKPKHELYKSGSLSAKQRINVFTRDNFKCTLCGNSPKTGHSLEIHHKNGTNSDLENLQTLCFLCHRGLHAQNKAE